VGILLVIVFTTGVLGKSVKSGFLPEEDEGYFLMAIQLPDAASLNRTEAVSKKVQQLLSKIEGIESVAIINGYDLLSGTANPNTATAFMVLEPWEEREHKASELIKKTNALMAKEVTDGTAFAFGPPPIPGLGSSAGFSLMLQDRGGNSPAYLAEQTKSFIAAASKRPEIGRIMTLFRSNAPQKSIQVDEDKVEKLNMSLLEVNGSISALLGGSFVNNFNAFGRQYRTYIQADAQYRSKPEDLSMFFVRDNKGKMVSLSTLTKVKDTSGPSFTNHFNLYRSAEISGAPAPGYSSSDALTALEEVAKETLPSDMGYQWSNLSYQEKEAGGKSSTAFLMALVFVFLILAAQYESWKLPFSVLLGTPWAVMGALLGLFIGGMFATTYVNNIFAQIGLVMLIGLNAKNAILIVEFAKLKMDEEGMPALQAAIEGAKLRFRPILMTSLAFILGVVPLLTATGAGSEARRVMGTTVFSGMVVATILGVILIPALFVLVEGRKKVQPVVKDASLSNSVGHE
jgi:HAE1 family hydrophobic/amphiphilic exporter-1